MKITIKSLLNYSITLVFLLMSSATFGYVPGNPRDGSGTGDVDPCNCDLELINYVIEGPVPNYLQHLPLTDLEREYLSSEELSSSFGFDDEGEEVIQKIDERMSQRKTEVSSEEVLEKAIFYFHLKTNLHVYEI